MVEVTDGAARSALQEVIPLVPDLAMELEDNPQVIQDALSSQLSRSDEELVPSNNTDPEVLLPKLETYALLGASALKAMKYTLEGGGRTARFHNEAWAKASFPDFEDRLQAVLESGYERMHRDEPWMVAAERRYSDVSSKYLSVSRGVDIGGSAGDLREALVDGGNTGATIYELSELAGRLQASPAEFTMPAHRGIMHDLTYLALSKAGLNIGSFHHAATYGQPDLRFLSGTLHHIERAETGQPLPVFQSDDPAGWRRAYPRVPTEQLVGPTLKCPVHQMPTAASQQPGGETATVMDSPSPTALQSILHASIELFDEHDV